MLLFNYHVMKHRMYDVMKHRMYDVMKHRMYDVMKCSNRVTWKVIRSYHMNSG